MTQATREGWYIVLVGGAALGAQALAGALLARALGTSPWTGAAVAMVAGFTADDIRARHSEGSAAPWAPPPAVATVLMAPALAGEKIADALVRPWLLPTTEAQVG